MDAPDQKKRWWPWLWRGLFLLIVAAILVVLLQWIVWPIQVFRFGARRLGEAWSIDPVLARAIMALFLVPLLYFLSLAIYSTKKKNKYTGIFGICVYVAVFSVGEWLAQRSQFFDDSGPRRCYIRTADGYQFFGECGIDPVTGLQRMPVTPEVIAQWRRQSRADGAQRGEFTDLYQIPEWFDPGSGRPLVWYSGDPETDIRFFLDPGFDPRSSVPLDSLTPEVVRAYEYARKQRQTEREQLEYESARREQEDRQRRAELEREQRLAAERARQEEEARLTEEAFVASILDRRVLDAFQGREGLVLIGIEGPREQSRDAERALASALQNHGVWAEADILRTGAFQEAVFSRLTAADGDLLNRLGLLGMRGWLLVGRVRISVPSQTGGYGAFSSDASVSLRIVDLSTRSLLRPVDLTFSVAAFSSQEVVRLAEKDWIDHVIGHPEMSAILR